MSKQRRIAFVDGMRGFAALFVVVYHLSGALREELARVFPDIVLVAFSYGFVGVPIFFVISGLVISSSLSREINSAFAGLFIVRRSLRLDPTYWAAILIALSTDAIKSLLLNTSLNLPPVSDVLLHVFYLQDLAQIKEPISVVYWTLCLEVQFYLFFMLSKWMSEGLGRKFSIDSTYFVICWLGIVAAWSLAIDHKLMPQPVPASFLPYWHYFFAGVLFSFAAKGRREAMWGLLSWFIALLLMWLFVNAKAYTVAAAVTVLVFFAAQHFQSFAKMFEGRVVLFLGSISYSLYLIHPDIGWKFISLSKLMLGHDLDGYWYFFIFIISILVSVFAAFLLYLLVEKPSLRLVEKVKKYGIKSLFSYNYKPRPEIPGRGV